MGRSKDDDDPEILRGQSNDPSPVDAESLQHQDLAKVTESKPPNNESDGVGQVDDVVVGKAEHGKEKVESGEREAGGSVPLLRLFAFADSLDYLLMSIGTVSAIVHGAAMPVFLHFFGKLMNGFGSNINNPSKTAEEVNKVIS